MTLTTDNTNHNIQKCRNNATNQTNSTTYIDTICIPFAFALSASAENFNYRQSKLLDNFDKKLKLK